MITFVKAETNLMSFQSQRQMHTWAFLQVMSPHYMLSSDDFYLCIFSDLSSIYTIDVSFLSVVAHWRSIHSSALLQTQGIVSS